MNNGSAPSGAIPFFNKRNEYNRFYIFCIYGGFIMVYSVLELADIFKVSTETVRRWIRNGELHCDSKSVKGIPKEIKDHDIDDFVRKNNRYLAKWNSITNEDRIGLLHELNDINNKISQLAIELENLIKKQQSIENKLFGL